MSPFPLPVLFTSWVWHDGAGIAGEVIRRAKLGGFKTVCVQLRESTPDDSTDDARTLDPFDVTTMQAAGLFVVGWDSVGADTQHLLETLPLNGWMPQVEGAGQLQALLDELAAGAGAGLPKALVTTYGGLDTVTNVNVLKSIWPDVFTFVECYKADGSPHENIDQMLWQGTQYGFDRSRLVAVVGTYRGEMPAEYIGLDAADYGGAYLVEPMTDAQLAAFAALVTPTEPEDPPVILPDPRELNAEIAVLADSWLEPHEGPDTLSRLRCIKRIATTTDTQWSTLRQDVVDALNGTVAALEAKLEEAEAAANSAIDEIHRLKDLLGSEQAARVEVQSLANTLQAKIDAAKAALQ